MNWHEEAVDRTVLLVEQDVLPGLGRPEIASQLLSTRVHLSADMAALATPSGQTALVTAFILTAELGAQISLDLPEDISPRGAQPPLGPAEVREELAALAADTISPLTTRTAGVIDLHVHLGDAPRVAKADSVVFCGGDEWACRLATEPCGSWHGNLPFGGVAAGVAIAAEAFRAAMRGLAKRHGLVPVIADAARELRSVELALPPIPMSAAEDLGRIDMISAGAIATSCLFTLLRVPGLRGVLRIVDDDLYALSNLNRYTLMRRFMVGHAKARALAAWSRQGLALDPVVTRFDESLADALGGLAPRVLVGVDNIPSRWAAQRACDGWLAVTGTSTFTVVDSGHQPGGPCAGCLHWRDDGDAGGAEIATVSFVSALAGLLQAYRLLAAHTCSDWAHQVVASPLNLSSPRAITGLGLVADTRCPVRCEASQALGARTTRR